MNKNDFVNKLTTLLSTREETLKSLTVKHDNEQSADEKKELAKAMSAQRAHIKALSRFIGNAAILDQVATLFVQCKLKESQLDEIERDAYSISKFANLMVVIAQKRKLSDDSGDDHALVEAMTNIVAGVNNVTASELGAKMRTLAKDGKAPEKYLARQPQMVLITLERLNAATAVRDGKHKRYSVNTDSALLKRLMNAYE